ncbi:MAG: NfeD family protein [Caulobacteraceae bacterium]|nr:NfeD family protein [Caulobacter sp.]
MSGIEALVAAQPGWAWLALGAALLATEAATGSGYLLWPAASAGVTGVLAFAGLPLGVPGQVLAFAVLTVVSTVAARRLWPRRSRASDPPDLNDMALRLVGHEGHATAAGRVFVDGKEWAAEWGEASPAPPGAAVRVLAVVGGAKLRVAALGV